MNQLDKDTKGCSPASHPAAGKRSQRTSGSKNTKGTQGGKEYKNCNSLCLALEERERGMNASDQLGRVVEDFLEDMMWLLHSGTLQL